MPQRLTPLGTAGGPEPQRLTPLETAAGIVLRPPVAAELPPIPADLTPRRALEAPIRRALERSPCLVSFSGGRDSSAVLAIAADVARREGLPPPVPATLRFPRAERAGEAEWQEQVVRHLGLEDWLRIDVADDLDCVGPVATAVLRRHGVLWPCNLHFHVPILEAAPGGSVLTGIGGDEALDASSWARTLALAARRARPVPRDVLRVGFALSPRPLKREVIARFALPGWEWLRPRAARAVRRAVAAQMSAEPLRWHARYRWLRRSGHMAAGTANLDVLAADAGTVAVHPFIDPRFLAAAGALEPAARFWTRTDAMRALVADLLPDALIGRPTKARFDEVVWSEHSRRLAERWDGEGVDHRLVDPRRLKEVWTGPVPDVRAVALLQSAHRALDSAARPLDEPEDRLARRADA